MALSLSNLYNEPFMSEFERGFGLAPFTGAQRGFGSEIMQWSPRMDVKENDKVRLVSFGVF